MKAKAAIFSRLENGITGYSNSQKVLARLILTDYQKIAFMTIRQFAEFSKISEATIVRFVKLLKFEGYPDFQKELRKIVRADLKGHERFNIAYHSTGENNDLLSDIINKEIDNLMHLQKVIDPTGIDKAIRSIMNASETVIIGTRSAASLACHFAFGLSKLGVRTTRILSIGSEEYDFLARLNPEAVVVLIGFPRYLNELLEVSDFCKERNLKRIIITDSELSPLVAEINLYSPAESSSFIAFQSAPLVLINTIISKLSMVNKNETLSVLNRFEKMAESRKYFAKR